MMMKIDIHIHTALTSEQCSPPERMMEHLEQKGVVSGIIMCTGETAVPSNEECARICSQNSRLHWCCGFDAKDPETVFDRMAVYKEAGAVGVGELCINERMDSPIVSAIFAAAQSMEMPVLFHMSPKVGFGYGIVDEPGLPLLEETLKAYPHLKLIGHSQPFWIEISADAPEDIEGRNGRGSGPVVPGGRVVTLMRQYPNLYADLSAGSGYCAITRDEAFGLAFITEFQDQLLFGTDTVQVDSPWQAPLWQWLEEQHAAGKLSYAIMQKICYQNAQKLYGIDLPHPEEETIVLQTACGAIRGICDENQHAFLGIPYAAADRFAYPEVTTRWEGTLDACSFGNCCWQFRAFRGEAMGEDPFYYREFREGLHFHYGDDCQRLNIWTSAQAQTKHMPVIVYIHGGAFLGGSSSEKHLISPKWTQDGVIAVTVNYRLGPFGFLCTREGLQEAGHTGNYGLYDLLAALQWIHENISAFGGDPARVTIMGQSAGCMCVQQLCLSPLAKDLFQQAVMLSGAGLSDTFNNHVTMEENLAFGDMVLEAAGCKNLAELRHAGAWKILQVFGEVLRSAKRGLSVTSPVIDGMLVPCSVGEAMKTDQIHHIPYIMCSTGDDLWQPELFQAILRWEKAAADNGIEQCYAACFARALPGDDKGAFHTADVWYWCNTLERAWRPFEAWDYQLAQRMSRYLTNFAKSGDPNGEGLPHWDIHTQADDQVMVMDDEEVKQKTFTFTARRNTEHA